MTASKIAYGSIGWVAWPLTRIAARLSAMGIGGIEGFGLDELLPEDRDLAADLARLRVAFVGSYFGASMVQRDRWETEVANFTTTVKKVAELGGSIVAVGGGRIMREKGRETERERWRNLTECANLFGKIAGESGIRLGFHPHNHTLVFREREIECFLKETDPGLVGLTFDTAHIASAGMEIVPALETFRNRVVHVHLKDEKNGEFLPLGKGELPLRDFLLSLMRGGYREWMTIELDATPDAEASTRESFTFVQRLLSSMERN